MRPEEQRRARVWERVRLRVAQRERRERQERQEDVGRPGSAVRVRARPVEGAANRELLAVLADALRVARSALAIEHGTRGREKRILVRGMDAGTVLARLAPRLVP